MERNIILAGVGGQGILSIAYVIDNAALDRGLHMKQAEVHGMAQRGGAVQSHLRISDKVIHSDLVPLGKADLIVSVEPIEALRYLEYLSPEGTVITSTAPFVNITNYPPLDEVMTELAKVERLVPVDAARLAKEAGAARAQNMVMVGAAAPLLQLPDEELEKHIASLFARKGQKIVDKNIAAYRAGKAVGQFFLASVEAGIARDDALLLATSISGKDIDPASVAIWKDAFTGPNATALREALAGIEPTALVTADVATAEKARDEGSL